MNCSNRRPWLALVVLVAAVSTGCVGTPVTFPPVPTQPYDESAGHRVTGEASGFQLLLFFPIGVNGRHARAWSQMQSQAPDQYITDITVQDSWTYAFVGTIYRVRMEGMAYPYRNR